MPWLPIYADEEDFILIQDYLNQCEEIAFIVSDGEHRWRAKRNLPKFESNRICLWHVLSGSLPLVHPYPSKIIDTISDPWSGWTELRAGADSTCPFFGVGDQGVFWLNYHPKSKRMSDGLALSSFEWIGNHYGLIGHPAPKVTEKFWQRLRNWTKMIAVRIPREGPMDGPKPEIWAFPSAYEALHGGRGRDSNP